MVRVYWQSWPQHNPENILWQEMRWTGFHDPNTVAAMNQNGQQTIWPT